MTRESKVWGERWIIRRDSTHECSFLRLKAGTRCSWHCHQSKYNLFVVLRGSVGIETQYGEVKLGHGEHFSVKPGEWHEFRAYEDSEMIEEMFVAYDEGDIRRERVGGPFNVSDAKLTQKIWVETRTLAPEYQEMKEIALS